MFLWYLNLLFFHFDFLLKYNICTGTCTDHEYTGEWIFTNSVHGSWSLFSDRKHISSATGEPALLTLSLRHPHRPPPRPDFWQKELFLHVSVDSFSLKVLRIDFFLLNQAVGTWKKSAPLSNFLCVFFRSNLYFKNISLHIFFLLLSLFIPSNLRMSYGKRHGTLGYQS